VAADPGTEPPRSRAGEAGWPRCAAPEGMEAAPGGEPPGSQAEVEGTPLGTTPEGKAAALGHEPPMSSPWQKSRRPRPRTAPPPRRRRTLGRGSGRRRAAHTAPSRPTRQGEGGPGRRAQIHAATKPKTCATPKRDNGRLRDTHEPPSPGPGSPPHQATQPAAPDTVLAPRSPPTACSPPPTPPSSSVPPHFSMGQWVVEGHPHRPPPLGREAHPEQRNWQPRSPSSPRRPHPPAA